MKSLPVKYICNKNNQSDVKGDPKFIKIIMDELVLNSKIKFDDIAGQEAAKQALKEMVIWPNLNPNVSIFGSLDYKKRFKYFLNLCSYFVDCVHRLKVCCYLDHLAMVRLYWLKQLQMKLNVIFLIYQLQL